MPNDVWEELVAEVWATAPQLGEDEVLRLIDDAVAMRAPDDSAAIYEAASVRDYVGRETEAEPLYRRALELGLDEPRNTQAIIQLASTLRNLGSYDDALTLLDGISQDNPLADSAAAFRALVFASKGDAAAAAGIALALAAPHLPRYNRAVAGYAAELLPIESKTTEASASSAVAAEPVPEDPEAAPVDNSAGEPALVQTPVDAHTGEPAAGESAAESTGQPSDGLPIDDETSAASQEWQMPAAWQGFAAAQSAAAESAATVADAPTGDGDSAALVAETQSSPDLQDSFEALEHTQPAPALENYDSVDFGSTDYGQPGFSRHGGDQQVDQETVGQFDADSFNADQTGFVQPGFAHSAFGQSPLAAPGSAVPVDSFDAEPETISLEPQEPLDDFVGEGDVLTTHSQPIEIPAIHDVPDPSEPHQIFDLQDSYEGFENYEPTGTRASYKPLEPRDD